MEIVYSEDQDVLLVMFKPDAVRRGEGEDTKRIELGAHVNLQVAEEGTVYALEIDGFASQKAELDAIKLITCDREGSSEDIVKLPKR